MGWEPALALDVAGDVVRRPLLCLHPEPGVVRRGPDRVLARPGCADHAVLRMDGDSDADGNRPPPNGGRD